METDWKKKYEEALERARKLRDGFEGYNANVAIIEEIFPELRESEDERMRRKTINCLTMHNKGCVDAKDIDECIDWLEKQKENPKSADSIPSDYVSDVKCEDRWHKVNDSLPDNGRLVIANDCLGNILLARYDGEGNWEVSVYDNDDYYCRNTITKWCDIPSEKQKEQIEEDLSTRLNGVMQEYVKAGKDEEEQEHRLKCYQLFWDALGDSEFFKQKEQKPVEIDEEHKVGKWFTGLIPCWIDAPSTLQSAHSYHGKNVIAIHEKSGGYRCCCVDDEKPITFNVAEDTHLVEGWKDRKPTEWNEQDIQYYDAVMDMITNARYLPCRPRNEIVEWFKSLKNRGNFPKSNTNSSSWSEEDEKRVKQLIYDTEFIKAHYEKRKEELGEQFNNILISDCDEQIAWLKSLHPQQKQRWTDEDDRICHLIMANLSESTRHAITLPMETVNMFNNWLRTLQCMPPLFTDWTDEDETLLSDALACVTMVQEIKKRGELKNFHNSCTGEELRSWIRSLKSRPRKQPSWKPSEEQIMEGAVEGEITKDIHNLLHVKSDVLPTPSEFKFGDKVKIKIIKDYGYDK